MGTAKFVVLVMLAHGGLPEWQPMGTIHFLGGSPVDAPQWRVTFRWPPDGFTKPPLYLGDFATKAKAYAVVKERYLGARLEHRNKMGDSN